MGRRSGARKGRGKQGCRVLFLRRINRGRPCVQETCREACGRSGSEAWSDQWKLKGTGGCQGASQRQQPGWICSWSSAVSGVLCLLVNCLPDVWTEQHCLHLPCFILLKTHNAIFKNWCSMFFHWLDSLLRRLVTNYCNTVYSRQISAVVCNSIDWAFRLYRYYCLPFHHHWILYWLSVWNKTKQNLGLCLFLLQVTVGRKKSWIKFGYVQSVLGKSPVFFFSEVEKLVMRLMICLQESDLFQGIMFLCYQLLNLF